MFLDVNVLYNGFSGLRSIVHEAILNDEEFPQKPVLELLFERRKEFDFNLSQDILIYASSDQIASVENFKLMCQWAHEKGANFGAVDRCRNHRGELFGGNTILHRCCQSMPWLAVFMLENVGKYGFDQDLIASMANTKNNAQLRPIDIIGSSEHFKKYFGMDLMVDRETGEFRTGRSQKCHKILSTELIKYTNCALN